jgi:hypothetical protein
MNSVDIIEILHSIKDVKLDSEGGLQIKFNEPDPIWLDKNLGWEPNAGYIYRSFTEQLLLLIEESLQGKLAEPIAQRAVDDTIG